MKLTYRIGIAIVLSLFSFQKSSSQELTIGQNIPNYIFSDVINYSDSVLKISDFKGKLVIFDFWSFWCSPCLSSFKKIDSIQNKYKDKIQIILVNRSTKDKTIEFFKTRKRLTIPSSIPLITTDTLLNEQFAHVGVPFFAWINSDGEVLYLTHEMLSEVMIQKHLNGAVNLFKLPAKDVYTDNIFMNGILQTIQYGTLIFKGMDSVSLFLENGNESIQYRARSIQDLYQLAYNESDSYGKRKFREPGRTILQVKDPVRFIGPDPGTNIDEWRGKHGYYYYSILPEHLKSQKYSIMKEELRRFFGLNVKIETRDVNCLALVRTSNIDKLRSKGGAQQSTNLIVDLKEESSSPNAIRAFKNVPFKELYNNIKSIGDWTLDIKIVDSTGYKGNIDFEFRESEVEKLTLQDLRFVLQRYNLDLIPTKVQMEVLILSE